MWIPFASDGRVQHEVPHRPVRVRVAREQRRDVRTVLVVGPGALSACRPRRPRSSSRPWGSPPAAASAPSRTRRSRCPRPSRPWPGVSIVPNGFVAVAFVQVIVREPRSVRVPSPSIAHVCSRYGPVASGRKHVGEQHVAPARPVRVRVRRVRRRHVGTGSGHEGRRPHEERPAGSPDDRVAPHLHRLHRRVVQGPPRHRNRPVTPPAPSAGVSTTPKGADDAPRGTPVRR